MRYVPKCVLSPAVTTVYKDKVAIILWTVIPEAIIIDNKDAAESYRSYFEFMWKHAHTSQKNDEMNIRHRSNQQMYQKL